MNAFKEIETGTTMKHLNVGDMLQLLVPVPPIAEQQAIAEALHIPAHRDRPFRLNVTACSGLS